VHARFLIRGINENGCDLFGQAGIALYSSLEEAICSHRLLKKSFMPERDLIL
jgi:hypothetical protein